MKCKNGLDLCGFQLTNFCVQGEASAPSDAALGRKYFHTNATDDVATGISLLHRERIYLGEGAWRATAYLDDIAAIQTKLDMILGDVDLDGVIENMNEVIKFLEDNKDTENLMTLLNGKLNKSGGTIEGGMGALSIKRNLANMSAISFENTNGLMGYLGFYRADIPAVRMSDNATTHVLIHAGNIGDYAAQILCEGNLADGSQALLKNAISSWDTSSVNFKENYGLSLSISNNPSATSGSRWRSRLDFGTSGKIYYWSAVNNNTMTYRGELAFTDSNVASAQALKHSNGTVGAVVNSSGNVTIGGSDLAVTDAKFLVNGKTIITDNKRKHQPSTTIIRDAALVEIGSIGQGNDALYIGQQQDSLVWMQVAYGGSSTSPSSNHCYPLALQPLGGNVLIGTTTDSGYKLDVNGTFNCNAFETSSNGECFWGGSTANYGRLTWGSNGYAAIFATGSNELRLGVGSSPIIRIFPSGDVRVTGNLVVDGEVSAGGAGAEEGTSGSGSAEGVSEIFTPTSTSMAFDHNLGEDVIVQVYEKSGNVWNMVMVDTEITSATRVTLRFGKTETTQHKVVIMGAGV